MHEMYGVIWKVALRIHEFLPVSKRGCYLALNTLLWCLMGMILYGAAILLTPYIFSTLYFFCNSRLSGNDNGIRWRFHVHPAKYPAG